MSPILKLVVVGILIGGCGRTPTTASNDNAGVRAAVTADVARHLTSEGKFVLRLPPGEERPLLTESVAAEIGLTAAIRLGPMVKLDLQAQHQGQIDFGRLSLCGKVYFAQTPFESIPSGLPSEMVYFLGSRWIIAVCAAGQPVISVAVAANATQTQRTRLGLFGPDGSVTMVGIPPGWDGAIPVSAEKAAILAASRTKRLLSSVPVLYAPNPLEAFPQGATWVFDVDGEVAVQGAQSGTKGTQRRFAVGTENVASNASLRGTVDLFISKPNERRLLPFYVPDGAGRVGADLHIRPGVWIDGERAVVGKDGGTP